MTAPAPVRMGWWRAVYHAFRTLGRIHVEQACMWDVQAVANRAAVPHEDPLTWVLTVDGYRLHGSYLPVGSGTR